MGGKTRKQTLRGNILIYLYTLIPHLLLKLLGGKTEKRVHAFTPYVLSHFVRCFTLSLCAPWVFESRSSISQVGLSKNKTSKNKTLCFLFQKKKHNQNYWLELFLRWEPSCTFLTSLWCGFSKPLFLFWWSSHIFFFFKTKQTLFEKIETTNFRDFNYIQHFKSPLQIKSLLFCTFQDSIKKHHFRGSPWKSQPLLRKSKKMLKKSTIKNTSKNNGKIPKKQKDGRIFLVPV